ncbi:UNVERIFIED_CONTAM: hypothetical protein FKN15_063664 [Acipenser sinensis]
MDRKALAELLEALDSRRETEERKREERYTALIEQYIDTPTTTHSMQWCSPKSKSTGTLGVGDRNCAPPPGSSRSSVSKGIAWTRTGNVQTIGSILHSTQMFLLDVPHGSSPVSVFKNWLTEKHFDTEFETASATVLNERLRQLYASVRCKRKQVQCAKLHLSELA